jgi:hypothetical protein
MKMTSRKARGKVLRRVLCAGAALAGLLALSCALPSSTGLVGNFGPTGTGTTTLEVRDGMLSLLLTGSVRVDSPDLQVRLTPPHGGDLYNETFTIPGTHLIDFTHSNPEAGTWTLSVESLGGSGQYDLRLRY